MIHSMLRCTCGSQEYATRITKHHSGARCTKCGKQWSVLKPFEQTKQQSRYPHQYVGAMLLFMGLGAALLLIEVVQLSH